MTPRLRTPDGKVLHLRVSEIAVLEVSTPTDARVVMKGGAVYTLKGAPAIMSLAAAMEKEAVRHAPRQEEELTDDDSLFGRIFDGPDSLFGRIFGPRR